MSDRWLYVGIDPGFEGAVAVIYQDQKIFCIEDAPYIEVKKSSGKGKKRYFDVPKMHELLHSISHISIPVAMVVLENVSPMPGEGTVSSFSFGRGLGNWEALITALELPLHFVAPQVWKKRLGVPQDKEASRLMAKRRWPTADLHLKSHHGRADALFLAYYAKVIHDGQGSQAAEDRGPDPIRGPQVFHKRGLPD